PASPDKSGMRTYENSSGHFKLQYPADWNAKDDPDFVLAIYPPELKPGDLTRRITIDLPHIPPHLPGMITMDKVKNGYLKDLKKNLMEMKVTEDSQQQIPRSRSQRVVVSGKLKGQPRTLAALLIIHSEHV